MDNYELTYAMIKTAVENGIKYIEDNPKRGVRNLLDLGEYFARGRFQKDFYDLAHEILNNEDSCYYTIIENMVKNTNHKTIRDYGINIGFNSFTYGANIIREYEKSHEYIIPWVIVLDFKLKNENHIFEKEISKFIFSSKRIGIYSYIILLNDNINMLEEVIHVIEKNEDCAFMIFVNPKILNEKLCEKLGMLTNLCISVSVENISKTSELVIRKAKLLKNYKCLYGAYTYYDDMDFRNISLETAKKAALIDSNYAILMRKPTCSINASKNLYNHIYKSRTKITKPIFPMDFYGDIARIGSIISDEPCFLSVDSIGQVAFSNLYNKKTKYNILDSSIEEILSATVK